MSEFLRYLKELEYLIYIILGIFTVWQLRKFYSAWEELRAAAFGLEKESAQARLNRSAALLVVLLFLATAEFGMVSFIIPAIPGLEPLPTATLDLLATPTIILDVKTVTPAGTQETPPPGTEVIQPGCIPDELYWGGDSYHWNMQRKTGPLCFQSVVQQWVSGDPREMSES